MPAMAAMHRIRFLSATGEGLQAWERIESYLASRLNGEKIFGSGSVSGKGVIRGSERDGPFFRFGVLPSLWRRVAEGRFRVNYSWGHSSCAFHLPA
jgi:hypothetical protein